MASSSAPCWLWHSSILAPTTGAGPSAAVRPGPAGRIAAVELPLLEDDLGAPGVIEPADVLGSRAGSNLPAAAVLCFFPEVVEELAGHGARRLGRLGAAPARGVGDPRLRRTGWPWSEPGIGAPAATRDHGGADRAGLPAIRRGGWGRGAAAGPHHGPRGDRRVGGARRGHLVPLPAAEPGGAGRPGGSGRADRDPDRWPAVPLPASAGPGPRTRCSGRPEVGSSAGSAEGCAVVEMEAAAFLAVARFRRGAVRPAAAGRRLAGRRRVAAPRLDDGARDARLALFRLAAAAAALRGSDARRSSEPGRWGRHGSASVASRSPPVPADQPAQQIGRRPVHDHRIGVRAERPAAAPDPSPPAAPPGNLPLWTACRRRRPAGCPRCPAAGRTVSPRRPGRPRAATPRAPASRGSRRPGWAGRRRCAPAPARSARPARRAPRPASRRSRSAPGAARPPTPGRLLDLGRALARGWRTSASPPRCGPRWPAWSTRRRCGPGGRPRAPGSSPAAGSDRSARRRAAPRPHAAGTRSRRPSTAA